MESQLFLCDTQGVNCCRVRLHSLMFFPSEAKNSWEIHPPYMIDEIGKRSCHTYTALSWRFFRASERLIKNKLEEVWILFFKSGFEKWAFLIGGGAPQVTQNRCLNRCSTQKSMILSLCIKQFLKFCRHNFVFWCCLPQKAENYFRGSSSFACDSVIDSKSASKNLVGKNISRQGNHHLKIW